MTTDFSTIYDFSLRTLNDTEELPLSTFKDKKLLLVNLASECGLTPQYQQLQELHELHGDKVAVLGFPCNDFGGQEPGTEAEIQNFCTSNYGVTFPVFEKIKVSGPDAHPLYKFLAQQVGEFVEWNFGKYVVDPETKTINYFLARTSPFDEGLLTRLGIE
jgi:glutathione peroxidase